MQKIILTLSLAFALSGTLFGQTPSLVVNGGFEQGAAGWQFVPHDANASGALDTTEHHSGSNSFRISNASAFAPNVYGRIFQTVVGLKPFTTYRVSCWAKGKGAGLNWIGGGPGWYTRIAFPTNDFDWRQFSFEVKTDAEAANYDLMIASESPTKAVWIDDVEFVPIATDVAKQQAAYAERQSVIDKLQSRVDALPPGSNAYIRLGRAVAQRFIDFARTGGPHQQLSGAWIRFQLEEVAQVLDETEKIAAAHSPLLDWTPAKPGPVKYKNGTFYESGRPHYFYGYGHFDSVFDDLPNFPALGAGLVQDGRAGPSSLHQDGTLGPGATNVLLGLDRAAQYGMRVDFLLSPHYFPAWANAPDLANGNIGFLNFNIDHPKARDAVGRWIAAMSDRIKDKPALHSVCLANEPVYNRGGADPWTRPMFTEFLRQKHQAIGQLNALYGTAYTNFDAVPVPPCAMPAEQGARRAYYDWTCFNKKLFADWHSWMDSTLKAHGVKAPTHTKIMVFLTMDRDKVGWGVDPELMCHATDLAGCDAYAFLGGAYAYDWTGHELFYDLLHSFRGQSVFNSENHFIPDGSPHTHLPMNHSRSVMWQDGLHHEGSSTIWVWQITTEDGGGSGLGGSIYFRPADVFGAGRAMLDLNRLAPEVTAINNARPRVAILDSQPSIFWEDKYKGTLFSVYTALTFMGEPVTFVSERQLAAGAAPKVEWIIAPNATHILDTTTAALERFTRKGGKVLRVGKESLMRDEYDRAIPHPLANCPSIEPGADDRATSSALRKVLALSNAPDLRSCADNQPAWGVEFRAIPYGNSLLVPMVNFQNAAQTVQFPKWKGRLAVDLLNGSGVNLESVKLEPMLPVLLRVSR